MPPMSASLTFTLSGDGSDFDESALSAALEALDRGELVLVPTETVYGVAARSDRPAARERLELLKDGRQAPYSHAVTGLDNVPSLAQAPWPSLQRIVERWWPGPVTVVVDDADGGTVGLRVPGHEFTRELVRRAGVPLLLPSANRPGEDAPRDFSSIHPEVRAACSVQIDGGTAALGEASTVVRSWPGLLRVLREGVIRSDDLRQRAAPVILVVCSGNTCRSPMAERLLAAEFAAAAESDPALIVPRIVSAGTFAGPGHGASAHAVDALEARGLVLDDHRSQPVDDALATSADLILTMTRSHAEALMTLSPSVASRVEPFDPMGRDVEDPFGGSRAIYDRCAAAIAGMAERRVAALVEARGTR